MEMTKDDRNASVKGEKKKRKKNAKNRKKNPNN